jgi:cell wall-associated NlpC family hydrolase
MLKVLANQKIFLHISEMKLKRGLIMVKRKTIILTIVLIQLFNTYCTRKLHPDLSYQTPPGKVKIPVPNAGIDVEKVKARPEEKIHDSLSDKKSQNELIRNNDNTSFGSYDAISAKIIETARKYLGIPHCMGGMSTKCIDCSGLVATVYGAHGISLPHNSDDQSRIGTKIKDTIDLRKGDLVFFSGSYKTYRKITHAGIYAGKNEFIHASSRDGVTINSLNDPYWKRRFEFGTRLLDTVSLRHQAEVIVNPKSKRTLPKKH